MIVIVVVEVKEQLDMNSVVDFCKLIGIASSFEARANYAVLNGVVSKKADYTGSEEQNQELLTKLKVTYISNYV